jgi:hypothetical protein
MWQVEAGSSRTLFARQRIDESASRGGLDSRSVNRWLGSSISWLPLLVVVLMAGVGVYAYRAIESATRGQLERELSTILQADVAALHLWIDAQKAIVQASAVDAELIEAVLELRRLSREADDPATAMRTSETALMIRELMQPAVDAHELDNFAVFDPDSLVLADLHDRLIGRRLQVQQARLDELLAGKTTFTRPVRDVTGGDDETFRKRATVFHSASPIRSKDGEVIGILAFAVGARSDFSNILQVARMGESGETYAFDRSGRMLSQSRFVDQLVALGLLPSDATEQLTTTIEIRDPGGNMVEGFVPELPVPGRPLTQMAAHAVSQGDGIDVDGYRDYRGVEVIGAWAWLPELELGVTTEIDRDEAYVGLDTLRTSFAALGGALLVGATGLLIYSMVVGRLQRRFDKARRLGRYELLEKIGEGGMGKVYRAKHTLLRRPTAVKLLEAASASGEAVQRFEREVQSASSLTHPNTIAIFDYGRTPDGTFYYAMEYLDGITLGDVVDEEGALPEARVVHIMAQAAASLAEAHAAGMVHRDLKPSNVMLCERGGLRDFVKVLDFGLVRSMENPDALSLTSVESLTGTPLYLAPEALEAPETVSARSDVYQLGAIGYYLLTGDHVFSGESLVEVLSQHLNKPPAPPSEVLGRQVSPELERLILQCLEKNPDDRPASSDVLYEALVACSFEGSWTQADARAWWAAFEQSGARQRILERAAGSSPSGLQIDLDRSRKSR